MKILGETSIRVKFPGMTEDEKNWVLFEARLGWEPWMILEEIDALARNVSQMVSFMCNPIMDEDAKLANELLKRKYIYADYVFTGNGCQTEGGVFKEHRSETPDVPDDLPDGVIPVKVVFRSIEEVVSESKRRDDRSDFDFLDGYSDLLGVFDVRYYEDGVYINVEHYNLYGKYLYRLGDDRVTNQLRAILFRTYRIYCYENGMMDMKSDIAKGLMSNEFGIDETSRLWKFAKHLMAVMYENSSYGYESSIRDYVKYLICMWPFEMSMDFYLERISEGNPEIAALTKDEKTIFLMQNMSHLSPLYHEVCLDFRSEVRCHYIVNREFDDNAKRAFLVCYYFNRAGEFLTDDLKFRLQMNSHRLFNQLHRDFGREINDDKEDEEVTVDVVDKMLSEDNIRKMLSDDSFSEDKLDVTSNAVEAVFEFIGSYGRYPGDFSDAIREEVIKLL